MLTVIFETMNADSDNKLCFALATVAVFVGNKFLYWWTKFVLPSYSVYRRYRLHLSVSSNIVYSELICELFGFRKLIAIGEN